MCSVQYSSVQYSMAAGSPVDDLIEEEEDRCEKQLWGRKGGKGRDVTAV